MWATPDSASAGSAETTNEELPMAKRRLEERVEYLEDAAKGLAVALYSVTGAILESDPKMRDRIMFLLRDNEQYGRRINWPSASISEIRKFADSLEKGFPSPSKSPNRRGGRKG